MLTDFLSKESDMALDGIDLSHHNLVTNWTALQTANIQFVYLKATEGLTYVDPAFARYWGEASTAGLRRGAYHFFHPLTSPEAQADHFCTIMAQLKTGDLPPAVDLEEIVPPPDEWPRVPPAQRQDIVSRFVQRLETNCGVRPVIYTRRGWLGDFMPDPAGLAVYPIWLADYQSQTAPGVPAPWTQWTFWQHSEIGTLPGIQGPVDLNRFFGSVQDLASISQA